MPGPKSTLSPIGRRILRLETELLCVLDEQPPEPDLDADVRALKYPADIVSKLESIYQLANDVMYEGPQRLPPSGRPLARLTRRALELAQMRGTDVAPLRGPLIDIACAESEALFAKSLRWHTSGRPARPEHLAAVVLYDHHDEPFAYQKAVGAATAFVWRDAHFPTQNGLRFAPGESIMQPIYTSAEADEEIGPHYDHPGAGLVALHGTHAVDLAFLRSTSNYLPPSLQAVWLQCGAGGLEGEDWQEAASLSSSVVAKRVGSLLAGGDVLHVGA